MAIIAGTNNLVRLVTVHDRGRTCVIEVDGELDLVSGDDLQHAFASALCGAGRSGAVALDLSHVTAVDDQGMASLEWCATLASEAHRVLEWTGKSVLTSKT